MNKTVRKIITTILFSMVCMVGMGISSNIARAEVIAVNEDGYYEYKDIDLEGYHYEYIHFKVSNYGTADACVRILSLWTEDEDIHIPSEIEGMKVTELCGNADEYNASKYCTEENYNLPWSTSKNKKYNSMEIPATVKRIVYEGFWNLRIKKLVIPKNVEYFGGDNYVQEVVIKGKNTEIGVGAFYNGHLRKITFPKGYQGKIGDGALSNCRLEEFKWPYTEYNKKKIGEGILEECKRLKKVTFDKNVKNVYIPKYCFYDCINLHKIEFPKTVKSVIYDFTVHSDNAPESVSTLVFKGKNTKLSGAISPHKKISSTLFKKNQKILTVTKVIAPRNSKAMAYAKKAYRIKWIKPRSPEWIDHEDGAKLAKVKRGYRK